ncbi:MAG: hypothetical protein HY720_20080 [Planctomycetes bacterium]|nr:hypothetical protein [Planctomycetota bacterium]
MKGVSRRERFLAALVVLVAAVATYGLARLRPAMRRIEAARAAAADAEARLAAIHWPQAPADPKALAWELAEVESERAALDAKLAELGSRFAQPGDATLRMEILALAQRTGVSIRETVPCPEEERAAGSERPLWRWTVEAPYGPLVSFLEGLGRLGRAATVLGFDVRAPETSSGRLRAVLVLAL